MFFLLILIFASFFQFNEVAKGSVVITSNNPIAHIIAQKSGKISKINYKAGDVVHKGDILAELQTNASVQDILYLNSQLNISLSRINTIALLYEKFPPELNLGSDIQEYYSVFWNNYQTEILNQTYNDHDIFDAQVNVELSNQRIAIENKKVELNSVNRNLEVSESHYGRYKQLFLKGVIAQVELEGLERIFLTEQRQYYLIKQEYNQLVLEHNEFENKLKLSTNDFIRSKNRLQTDLEFSKQSLLISIKNWEESYLLRSPIDGRLTYFDVWGEFQDIKKGEIIFSVIPLSVQSLTGKCVIPLENAGRLKTGQRANLKLENYPFREWGMVKAEVKTISEIPRRGKNPAYIVYLNINDLKTSFGKELQFHQELNGTVEILLNKTTLMEKMLFQFRHLWANNNF